MTNSRQFQFCSPLFYTKEAKYRTTFRMVCWRPTNGKTTVFFFPPTTLLLKAFGLEITGIKSCEVWQRTPGEFSCKVWIFWLWIWGKKKSFKYMTALHQQGNLSAFLLTALSFVTRTFLQIPWCEYWLRLLWVIMDKSIVSIHCISYSLTFSSIVQSIV